MKVLGVVIQNDGRISYDVGRSLASAHKSIIMNLSKSLISSFRTTKKRFMVTCVRSLLSWKWASWQFSAETATLLDSLQRMCIALLWPIPRVAGESSADFWERQRADTKLVARDMGLWSEDWGRGILGWAEHVARDHTKTWSRPILAWKDASWLSRVRQGFDRKFPSLAKHGITRTNSRLRRGTPPRRWQVGCDMAQAKSGAERL